MRLMRRILALLLCLPLTAQAAATYIGAGAFDQATNDNELNPTVHASTASGDTIIVAIHRGHDSGDGGALTTGTTLTDFTLLEFVSNAAGTSELAVYCKDAAGSD